MTALSRAYGSIDEVIDEWWKWTRVRSGSPARYKSAIAVYQDDPPNITDEDAMKVDHEICLLRLRMPDEQRALIAFLKCNGNMTATSKALHTSTITARLYVRRAEAWLEARLFE